MLLPCIQTCAHIQEHPLHKSQVENGGEFKPTRVHKPFSLLELRQIKQDLGSYTDDPGKYIDTFQHITLAFDLTWKDIMVIFSQTLSDPEHTRVLKEAQSYATGLHMSSDKYPVGETVVPSSDPNWNYNDPEHIWEKDHFLLCVKTGLKAAQKKSNQLCLGLSSNSGAQ